MEPTIGRVVHFHPDKALADKLPGNTSMAAGKPIAAVVVAVWGPEMVNLRLLADGPPSEAEWVTSVKQLVEGGDIERTWEWPPRV